MDPEEEFSRQGMQNLSRMGEGALRLGRNVLGGAKRKAGQALGAGRALKKRLLRVGIILLVFILILSFFITFFGTVFFGLKEERGTSAQQTMDPLTENPTVRTEDGLLHAAALVEPQALIDAYYKYLSVGSYEKYVNGTLYRFTNPEQCEDFAGLKDYEERENSFYLSSSFIKMADELLHEDRFYYPEQVIRPVNYKINDDGLVEGLPIFDETTKEMNALSKAWNEDGTAQTDELVPGVWDYGFGSVLQYEPFQKDQYISCQYTGLQVDIHRFSWVQVPAETGTGGDAGGAEAGGGDAPAAESRSAAAAGNTSSPSAPISTDSSTSISTNASAPIATDVPTANSAATAATTEASDIAATAASAVTDVSAAALLGSQAAGTPAAIRLSAAPAGAGTPAPAAAESGTPTEGDGGGEAGAPATRWETTDTHSEVATVPIGECTTVEEVRQAIQAVLAEKNGGSSFPTEEGGADYYDIPAGSLPTDDQIAALLDTDANSHIAMRVTTEDQEYVDVDFQDPNLSGFSNENNNGFYPIRVPLIVSAACMSGNLFYHYDEANPADERSALRNGTSDDPAANATDIILCSGCEEAGDLCGIRMGDVHETLPSCTEETHPWGFSYLETYCSSYVSYVPQGVLEDLDFTKRLNQDDDILSVIRELGLLIPYGASTLSAGSTATEDDVGWLAKAIRCEAGGNKLDELMVGAVVVNRLHYKDGNYWGKTVKDVLSAPGQYSTWSSGAIQNAVPSERDYESARQCLTGEFAIPSNVMGQALFLQGVLWMTTDNSASGGRTQYYCTLSKREAPTDTDWLGRAALTPQQARDLAASLDDGTGEGKYAIQDHPDTGGGIGGSLGVATTSFTADDVYNLAKLITCEAGQEPSTYYYEQLCVGAVFMNLWKVEHRGATVLDVVNSGAYDCAGDTFNACVPVESAYKTARQVLTGEFALPANCNAQDGETARTGASLFVRFSHPGATGADERTSIWASDTGDGSVDWLGRPAKTEAQLRNVAAALDDGAGRGSAVKLTDPLAGWSSSQAQDASRPLFVGHSLIVGIRDAVASDHPEAGFIAQGGLHFSQMDEVIYPGLSSFPDATTVVVGMGTNDLGASESSIRQDMNALIQEIRTVLPNAGITILSVPPLCEEEITSPYRSSLTNANVRRVNAILRSLCTNGVRFLDCTGYFGDSLDPDWTGDGVHLNSGNRYQAWYEWIVQQLGLGVSAPTIYGQGQTTQSTGADVPEMDLTNYDTPYRLYQVKNFDVLAATSAMRKITEKDTSWLERIFGNALQGLLDSLGNLFHAAVSLLSAGEDAIYPNNDILSSPRVRNTPAITRQDARDIVYQTVTFSGRISYEEAVSQLENEDDLTFLFVGKEAGSALGTSSATARMVPGTACAIEDFVSPTTSYYAPTDSYGASHLYTLLAVPSGTIVQSVAAGTILSVNLDETAGACGRCVEAEYEKDGVLYRVTYGNLDTVSVSAGASVEKQQEIGTCGAEGFWLSMTINGTPADPMRYFYQPVASSGVPFADLLGPDGYVSLEKAQKLQDDLGSVINWRTGNLDRYHAHPEDGGINGGKYGECPWYAWGRGAQYLESIGYPVANLQKSFGDGGDYYASTAGWFERGQEPRANSWVCWVDKTGGYGHVAYVEAVDPDGTFWFSEGYHDTATPVVRHAVKTTPDRSKMECRWSYKSYYYLAGFIYLDQPLK